MNKIDISTEEKKKNVLEIFESFEKKGDIHSYFNIPDNKIGINYINNIAEKIGFDFSFYKKKKEKHCLNCGKVLRKQQVKFCSKSCAAKINNPKRTKNLKVVNKKTSKKEINKTSTNLKKFCLQCGKELKTSQTKFCSNECSSLYRKEETIKKWLETGNCGKNCNGALPESIKEYLFKKANYKCSVCGFEGYNKITGKTILQIHHIDGDAYNNNINNLQVLCPNHHAMTENFMNLNKGKSTRKNRYKK